MQVMKALSKIILVVFILVSSAKGAEGNSTTFSCSFSVYPSSYIVLKNKGTKIIFPSIFLNDNNCYNTCDGVFRPLLDGIYHFQWKITTHGGKHAAVGFHVNGKYSGPDVLVSSAGIGHNSVTGFAVVRLKRGDQAYLVTNTRDTFIVKDHSGFGGYFVSE